VVGDDLHQSVLDLLAPINAQVIGVTGADAAVTALALQHFACLVLDLSQGRSAGWEVVDKLQTSQQPPSIPVLAYTNQSLTPKQAAMLSSLDGVAEVTEVTSADGLRDGIVEVLRQLRSNAAAIDSPPVKTVAALAGKKILIVDDDIRNIFALTAMLERQQMYVVAVESGQDAIEILRKTSDFDIALVDIMMPEMDGYVTMSEMRKLPIFKERPIIALTAKAMSGDREKCIEAGASDYVAKPVNTGHLIALLETWLSEGDVVEVT
jgi:CheY-like chemotaxis protein